MNFTSEERAERRALLKKLIHDIIGRDVEVADDTPVQVDGKWFWLYM